MTKILGVSLGCFILTFSQGLIADNPLPYGTDGYYSVEGYFGPDIVPNYNPGDPGMVDDQNKIFDQNEDK